TLSVGGTTGNVGIGTTVPGATLDVNGSATVSGNLTLSGGARTIATRANTTLQLGDNQTGNINFFNANTVLTSAGNLTIAGNLVLSNSAATTTFGGITYTWPTAGQTNGYALLTNGSGTLSW